MMDRRTFLALPAGLALASKHLFADDRPSVDLASIDHDRIVTHARQYLSEPPVTVTSASSPRSAGGRHDYFSEGDYWWPDPRNPEGPYIQRDGRTNPDNFVEHRKALIRLSVHVPALAAAWLVTRDLRFSSHAARHLRAWFLDDATRMNPSLRYAQAIHGRVAGRGTGIIDTIHLVEVVRAIPVLERARALTAGELGGLRQWFTDYLAWVTTDQYGKDERDAKNNHGTCWVMQVAEFARFTGNSDLGRFCRDRVKTVLVPGQIAADGSFPEELRRTKPYGYCLFNLDVMATACQILSTPEDDLWRFTTADGRGLARALEFMFPFIADKRSWPRPPDVMYFGGWPVRHPALLFGGIALNKPGYIDLWRRLDPDPAIDEIVRNYPIRQPILWMPVS